LSPTKLILLLAVVGLVIWFLGYRF